MRSLLGPLAAALAVAASPSEAPAQGPVAGVDFRRPGAAEGWRALHDVRSVEASPEGLAVHLDGPDPYFAGPAIELPEGVPLTATVRIKAQGAGDLQVFYMRPGEATDEERSARRSVRAGDWREVTFRLPPIGPRASFRIDPPGTSGVCLIESIRFAPRPEIEPRWPEPGVPTPPADAPSVTSGPLALRHDPARFGSFTLSVDGREVATGLDRPAIAYRATVDGRPVVKWIDASVGARVETTSEPPGTVRVRASFRDEEGGSWRLEQAFRPHSPGVIAFEAECAVDAPRSVFHAPLLVVLPGHGQGTFAASKGQALLAGVEYLEDEPSSSTADLGEADALRKVPSAAKLTFPLMAVQARGRYVGLIWDRAPDVAALFDSPDRTLGGGGHLMGLIGPGADGDDRSEGAVFPDEPKALTPGKPWRATGFLIGGAGTTIVPAVQKYVDLKGLPPIPRTPGLQEYVRLAAAGWLDSPIRDGGRFRHAAGAGDFRAQPAADAAWMMTWLASLADDAALAGRLAEAAAEAEVELRPDRLLLSAVGHNRYPVAPLVLRSARTPDDGGAANFRRAVEAVAAESRGFEPDGSRRYRPLPGRIDYGRTHFGDEANGYAAQPVDQMLRLAAFSGDGAAVEEALRLLSVLRDRFRDGVPRGAQTWEIALHTPDVLASAYLVRAFALGYELTGDASYLDAAKYWAWTGVPFVYLDDPTGAGGVGPYATTPVLGSTNWVAPNWIGLPVQWCGLVYADALIELDRHDPDGPWSKIADGIAASGVLQTYPLDQPSRGLLPDSFNLTSQARNPADINPGTLQPGALRLLVGPRARPYQFRALRGSGVWACVPGSVEVEVDRPGEAALVVHPWKATGSFAVLHGVPEGAEVVGEVVRRDGGTATLRLDGAKGPARVVVRSPK